MYLDLQISKYNFEFIKNVTYYHNLSIFWGVKLKTFDSLSQTVLLLCPCAHLVLADLTLTNSGHKFELKHQNLASRLVTLAYLDSLCFSHIKLCGCVCGSNGVP